MRAPAFGAAVSLVTGIVLADRFELSSYLLLSLFTLCLILSIVFLRRIPWLSAILILLSLLAAGMWRYESVSSDFPWNHVSNFVNLERPVTLKGWVSSDPDVREDRTYLTVTAESLLWRGKRIKATGKVLIKIKHPSDRFDYGDLLSVKGYLFSPLGRRNPGSFDYQKYLNTKDIYGQVTASQDNQVQILGSGGNYVLKEIISPARKYLIRHFNQTLAEPYNHLLSGFVLGEKRGMPDDLREKFVRTGTLHLMAVSGSNVGLVLLLAYFASLLFRLQRRARFVFLALVIIFFALLTNLQPSVVRASIMALLALLAFYAQREVSFLNLVSLTAFLILLFNPQTLYDVSFQLSFGATLAIGLLVPQMGKGYDRIFPSRPRIIYRWLILPFFVSAAAILGVAPLQVYYFHNFPLIGFFSNLVVVPLVGISIILAGLSALLSLLWNPVAQIFVAGNWLVLKSTLLSVDFFGNPSFALAKVPHPPQWALWIYPFALLLTFYAPQSRRARLGLILTLATVLALTAGQPVKGASDSKVTITILDVSPAQVILFELPDSKRLLWIQESASTSYNYLNWSVIPFLYHQGAGAIDRLLVSAGSERLCSLTTNLKANLSVAQILTTGRSDSLQCREYQIRSSSEEPLDWEGVKLSQFPPDNRQEPIGLIFEFKEFTFMVLNRLDSLQLGYESRDKPVIACWNYEIFKRQKDLGFGEIRMDQIIVSGWDFKSSGELEKSLTRYFPGRKIWWTKTSGAIQICYRDHEFRFKPTIED